MNFILLCIDSADQNLHDAEPPSPIFPPSPKQPLLYQEGRDGDVLDLHADDDSELYDYRDDPTETIPAQRRRERIFWYYNCSMNCLK